MFQFENNYVVIHHWDFEVQGMETMNLIIERSLTYIHSTELCPSSKILQNIFKMKVYDQNMWHIRKIVQNPCFM